jgi:hypothetical protein
MARVSIKRHHSGGYVGSITLRSNADQRVGVAGVGDIGEDVFVTVGAIGDSGADALLKSASVLDRMSQDPVMQAILPPQAQAAIATTRVLASAAKRGLPTLKKAFGGLFGGHKKKKSKAKPIVRALAKSTPARGRIVRSHMNAMSARDAVPLDEDDYDDEDQHDEGQHEDVGADEAEAEAVADMPGDDNTVGDEPTAEPAE